MSGPFRQRARWALFAGLLLSACTVEKAPQTATTPEASFAPLKTPLGQVAGMRRLTEAQYRNSIADIFGPDIKVAGRFEPIEESHDSLTTILPGMNLFKS